MTGYTIWFPPLLLLVLVLAAAWRLRSRREQVRRRPLRVDDAAIEQILRQGSLTVPDDEPLDEEEIARAEREFWQESWDEPEEYGR